MKTAVKILFLSIFTALQLTACGLALGYTGEKFIDDLRDLGSKVDYTALVAPNMLLGPGSTILVNNEMVHIYEFPDTGTAEDKMGHISPDGAYINLPYRDQDGNVNTVVRERLEWEGTPHFYQRGRLIVVYVGTNPELIDILHDLLKDS